MDHQHRSKYRQGDQWVCPGCGKAWDVDDADVPDCVTERAIGIKQRDQEKRKKARRSKTGHGAWSG